MNSGGFQSSTTWTLLKIAMAGLVVIGLLILAWIFYNSHWGHLAWLKWRKDSFLEVVERYRAMEADGTPKRTGGNRWESGGKIKIDPGPPLRVGFIQSSWGPDMWSGVVWDESGELRRAVDEIRAKYGDHYLASEVFHADPQYQDALGVFAGYLGSCDHLEGPWYWCSFN